MGAVYPSARTAFLSGLINLLTDDVRLQLVGAYTYSDAHTALSHLTGTISTPAVVSVTGIAAGVVAIAPVTFPAIGTDVTGLVAYSGTRLLAYIDRRGDSVPIAIDAIGGDLTFTFDYLLKI